MAFAAGLHRGVRTSGRVSWLGPGLLTFAGIAMVLLGSKTDPSESVVPRTRHPSEEVRFLAGVRPGLGVRVMFETTFGLMREGKTIGPLPRNPLQLVGGLLGYGARCSE